MVSNSLASCANSSSASGSSRTLTEPTATLTSASSPACGPATSLVLKVLVSPDFMPTSASSRPSISWPDPTSWDSPSVLASGTSSPSTVADRSMDTKSPSSTAPLDTGQGAESGPQRLQLVVDVLVADLDRVDRDLEGTQVRQRDLRADVDLGGEHQLLAVLDLGDLDFGLTQRLHLGGGQGLAVTGGQRVVDDLLEHRAATDAGLQQLGGRLARAEAGQPDLLRELLVGAVEVGLQLVERHLYIDANPGGAQLLDGALHGYS